MGMTAYTACLLYEPIWKPSKQPYLPYLVTHSRETRIFFSGLRIFDTFNLFNLSHAMSGMGKKRGENMEHKRRL